MSSISINTGTVRNAVSTVAGSAGGVQNVMTALSRARSVAGPIGVVSHGLDGDFARAQYTISEIDQNVQSLIRTVNSIATQYEATESQVASLFKRTALGGGAIGSGVWGSPGGAFIGGISSLLTGGGIIGFVNRAVQGVKKNYKVTAEGSLLSGKLTGNAGAEWDPEKGNVYAEASGKAEGWLARGTASADYGLLHSEVEATVGDVYAKGEAKASLMKDGVLDPEIELSAGVGASVLSGKASTKLGTDDVNANLEAKGEVLTASASASAGISSDGVHAKASAEAYAAKGEINGGIEIFGVKFGLGVEGKAGGAGASAGGSISTTSVSGEIGAGLGLGIGLKGSIDWSGAVDYWKSVNNGANNAAKSVVKGISDFGSGIASFFWNGH